ncbi:hypothetical protein ACFSJQ_18260 [Vibrio olivae]|uniref:DUF2059 domain-containing protein n=1 Tax=Vibrio olivae TaxID=1243002 RepID=A0ABV5HNK3_9VIBR
MKIKAPFLGIAVGLSVFAVSAHSAELDVEALSSTIQSSTQDVRVLTSQQLSAHPDDLVSVLSLLLQLKPESASDILAQAMIDYPEMVMEFVTLARELGISNEMITIAAVEAGLDPTQLAEQTAAGVETVVPTPIPPIHKAPVSRS